MRRAWMGSLALMVLFVLAGVPAGGADDQAPRVESHLWEGHLACSVYVTPLQQPYNCHQHSEQDDRIRLEVEQDLKSIVVAMDWDVAAMAWTDTLRNYFFLDDPNPFGTNAHVKQDGPPVLEYRVDCDTNGGSLDCASWADGNMTMRVWTGTVFTFGWSFDQPFRVHYDLYYGEHAPDGASALP